MQGFAFHEPNVKRINVFLPIFSSSLKVHLFPPCPSSPMLHRSHRDSLGQKVFVWCSILPRRVSLQPLRAIIKVSWVENQCYGARASGIYPPSRRDNGGQEREKILVQIRKDGWKTPRATWKTMSSGDSRVHFGGCFGIQIYKSRIVVNPSEAAENVLLQWSGYGLVGSRSLGVFL